MRRKFPPLTHTVNNDPNGRENAKGEEKREKEKKSKKERKEGKEERNKRKRKQSVGKERKRKGKGKGEREDFSMLRRSMLNNPSTKFGVRSVIYVLIPKSWSFDKLQKVGDFPTWFTFSLKAL